MKESKDVDELKALYEESFKGFAPGEIVKGKVVKRLGSQVLVDLGLKAEGILSLDEFRNPDEAEEGKEVVVFLETLEGREGLPVISKRKADFQLAWETVNAKAESGEGVKARVAKRVKGGLQVEILGLDAFLPGSQVDIRPPQNLDDYINQEIEVKIIKVNWPKKNIVVSRRMLLEEELMRLRLEILSRLSPGDVIPGVVKNLTDFGAFIDIGGVDALMHITDIAWTKLVHPSEVLSPGQELKVKVLTVDPESGRLTVGLKQLVAHPWEGVESRYPIGSRVRGRVTSLTDYGAFVELEKGIEGLIHISEMSWIHVIRHPSQVVKPDDEVEVVVLNIDKENRRISLGLKQTEPDPWSLIEEHYKVGERIKGKVKSLKDFGAFVELEAGIEGLIHNSDLSWTQRVRHPRAILKKEQEVEAVILAIDKENRRISLGLKQTQEDPLYLFSRSHKPGEAIKGKVIDLPGTGVVAQVDYGLEGYIPLHQLQHRDLKRAKDKYQMGEELNLLIQRIDLANRRIHMSERAYYEKEKPPAPRKRRPSPSKVEAKREKFPIEEHLK
jgi:small subunit ribosomal protein S1